VAALLALVSGAAACAVRTTPAPEVDAPGLQQLSLQVRNQSPLDVVIYLAGGGTPVRLGRAAALRDTDLVIPRGANVDTEIRLLLRSDSGESYAPETVWVVDGQEVQLTVRSLLRTSDVIVRGRGTDSAELAMRAAPRERHRSRAAP
jgi:hypothetical protein